jgi:hypothetical protein
MDKRGEVNIRFSQLYCGMRLEMDLMEIDWEDEQWIRLSSNMALVCCRKPSDESSSSIQMYYDKPQCNLRPILATYWRMRRLVFWGKFLFCVFTLLWFILSHFYLYLLLPVSVIYFKSLPFALLGHSLLLLQYPQNLHLPPNTVISVTANRHQWDFYVPK